MTATLADIQRKYGDSVYPLYKDQMHEPYMESNNGIGYKGVVMYDELEDKVQCAECGKWFEALSTHLKIHKLTGREYKDSNGLFYKVPLCSKKLSNKRSMSAIIHNTKRTNLLKGYKHNKGSRILVNAQQRAALKIQSKNKHGLCDAQVAARLLVVRDICGYKKIQDIKSADVRKYDRNLYGNVYEKYGTIKKACKALKLQQSRVGHYEDSEVIALLRKFVIVKKRMPRRNHTVNDFVMGTLPTEKVFVRLFGSFKRAKMMAGLDQLLEEVKAEKYA